MGRPTREAKLFFGRPSWRAFAAGGPDHRSLPWHRARSDLQPMTSIRAPYGPGIGGQDDPRKQCKRPVLVETDAVA